MALTQQQIDDANKLLQQGDVLGQQASQATGVAYSPSTSISSADLAPVKPLNLPPAPQAPDYQGITSAIPQIDLSQFQAPSKTEETQSDISKMILQLTESGGGRGQAQLQAEQQVGLPQLRQQLQDAANQLQAIQKEQAAIPLQIQQEFTGRGATRAGTAPIETGRLRENAIKALSVSAIAQTLQGNLSLAQSQIDRAIDLEFDAEEQKLKYLQTAYQLNKDVLEREDKKRSTALQVQLAERERLLDEQKENKKRIFDVSLQAAQSGADNATLTKIQGARSPQEAITIAGSFLGEEFRQKLEQQKFERDLQKAQFNLSYEKFQEDVRQFDMDYALTKQKFEYDQWKKMQEQDPVAAAEASSEILDNKINLIDSLLGNIGLQSAVGPTFLGRLTKIVDVPLGITQNFIAGVEQLVNKETIDTLVNLKARGGTLGAL